VPHSLTVSLNGSDLLGLLCNGKGTLTATPKFTAIGATNSGFSWQLLDGGKVLKSGHGSGGGEGIVIDMGGHVAGVMQIAVSDHGVISIEHGTQKLVIASDTKDAIGAKTGGYLKFEDLGLRVGGTAEFAILNTVLKSGVQPPGI
ncbi:MAG TPA: hypothetical protein VFD22_00465, partial [Gemmatimonadaceae bacterium]|nr:hypothetical protein [Gemmatimonadaceae bacterium]